MRVNLGSLRRNPRDPGGRRALRGAAHPPKYARCAGRYWRHAGSRRGASVPNSPPRRRRCARAISTPFIRLGGLGCIARSPIQYVCARGRATAQAHVQLGGRDYSRTRPPIGLAGVRLRTWASARGGPRKGGSGDGGSGFAPARGISRGDPAGAAERHTASGRSRWRFCGRSISTS